MGQPVFFRHQTNRMASLFLATETTCLSFSSNCSLSFHFLCQRKLSGIPPPIEISRAPTSIFFLLIEVGILDCTLSICKHQLVSFLHLVLSNDDAKWFILWFFDEKTSLILLSTRSTAHCRFSDHWTFFGIDRTPPLPAHDKNQDLFHLYAS